MSKVERRYLSGVELRASAGDGIEGYAAIFNSPSEDLGGFKETIRPGAFARAIRTGQDVRALFNHCPNLMLGRTRSGTLSLFEDGIGLRFDCKLPNTSAAQDLRALIARRDVTQCCFSFACQKDEWARTPQGDRLRILVDVDLFDVSPVTFPAYLGTSVDARSLLWPDGAPDSIDQIARANSPIGISYHFIRPASNIHLPNPQMETERARARLRLVKIQDGLK
jgi:HK97 family phage prohead protease